MGDFPDVHWCSRIHLVPACCVVPAGWIFCPGPCRGAPCIKTFLAALAAAFSLCGGAAQAADPPKSPLKVAVVHVAPVTEAGWVRQHENARLALEKALGPRVQTFAVENVAEGADAERVIRRPGATRLWTDLYPVLWLYGADAQGGAATIRRFGLSQSPATSRPITWRWPTRATTKGAIWPGLLLPA